MLLIYIYRCDVRWPIWPVRNIQALNFAVYSIFRWVKYKSQVGQYVRVNRKPAKQPLQNSNPNGIDLHIVPRTGVRENISVQKFSFVEYRL